MRRGIGIDIVEIDHMREIMNRSGIIFLKRVFTEDEILYGCAAENPVNYFASSFAMKEAVFKAMVLNWEKKADFTEIEVFRGSSGEPVIRLHGRVEALAEEKGYAGVLTSITYGKGCALAAAVAV
jgi:holo-[acyl-carrier protein] synthase